VDVVISNCVVNLSTDKPAVFRETFRVLKSGGRIGITDVVAEDQLSPEDRAERGAWVGCIAGALSKGEYEAGLAGPPCRWHRTPPAAEVDAATRLPLACEIQGALARSDTRRVNTSRLVSYHDNGSHL
jgi:hypothetical protein